MATSDSHEKSTEYRILNDVGEKGATLSNAPRLITSNSNSSLPDTNRQPNRQPNTNVELDVGGDADTDIKCGFVELDLSEKIKNVDLPRGRRRFGVKTKKHKDSSKSVSLSKKKKKQEHGPASEHTGPKCGCNLL